MGQDSATLEAATIRSMNEIGLTIENDMIDCFIFRQTETEW